KTGLNVSGAINNSNQASDGSSTGYVNPFFFTRTLGPIYPAYAHDQISGAYLLNSQGERFYDYGGFNGQFGIPSRVGGASPGRHILEETKLNQSSFKRNSISARAYGSIIFAPWLKFTTNISVDLTDFLSATYENTKVGDGAPAGRASKNSQKTTAYTFNQLLEGDHTFKQHHVGAIVGHENYDYTFDLVSGQRQGQILEGNVEFPNFTTTNSINSRVDLHRIESYFTRLNYDFDGKYFISANFRRDANSRFAKDVRTANFWGAGIAWRIDRESFMNVKWIDNLKLRSSYGQLGNDGVGTFYAYQAFYSYLNNALEPGTVQNQLPNTQLTWETSNPFDAGIDFGLFKNRVRGSVEFYNRQISVLIFDIQLPLSTGGFVIPTNVGNMYNRGIEVDLGVDVLRKKNFN